MSRSLQVSYTDISLREYKKITIDYPLAAAEAFSSLSDKFKFVYVSGMSFQIALFDPTLI